MPKGRFIVMFDIDFIAERVTQGITLNEFVAECEESFMDPGVLSEHLASNPHLILSASINE
jgi:hypothetical protein